MRFCCCCVISGGQASTFEDTIFCGIDEEAMHAFTAILAALCAQARPGESLVAPLALPTFGLYVRDAVHRAVLQAL